METLKKLNSLYSKTEKLQRDKKERKKLNIVIIGGSHSGFSCAWILLNGPSNPNINPKKAHKEEQQREEEHVVIEEHLKNITNRSTTSLHNEKEMHQKENSPGPRDPSPKRRMRTWWRAGWRARRRKTRRQRACRIRSNSKARRVRRRA